MSKRLIGTVSLFAGLAMPVLSQGDGGTAGDRRIWVDQVGYRPEDAKIAWLSGPGASYSLVDQTSGQAVLSGSCGHPVLEPNSQEMIALIDFSSWRTEGVYRIDVPGTGSSFPFRIAEDVYGELFAASLKMLYYQRCGIELTSGLAGDFRHGACHLGEAEILGTEKTLTADGGWHDAGDYGKYVVPGAITLGHLLLAWELWPKALAVDVGIPESGKGVPDVLAEARYELEWMLRMQEPEGGGVYHKLTSRTFPPLDTAPDSDLFSLVVSPISYTATADFGAIMAMAARVWQDYDPAFATTCLAAARKAHAWVGSNPFVPFTNPPGIVTGEYGDPRGQDEALWMAVELLRTTGEPGFAAEVGQGLADRSFRADSFGWADTGMFSVTGVLAADPSLLDEGTRRTAHKLLQARVAQLRGIAKDSPDRTMMAATDFIWGSNMSLMDQAMILLTAKRLDPEMVDASSALDNLHYLLGRNALGKCFVTGFGSDPVMNPHHRPSLAAAVFRPIPGMVSGGPNSGLQDPVAKNNLAGQPPAKCFLDDSGTYSTNEVAIYWNSPLSYVLAALDQQQASRDGTIQVALRAQGIIDDKH